jgi:hypothetical protein
MKFWRLILKPELYFSMTLIPNLKRYGFLLKN